MEERTPGQDSGPPGFLQLAGHPVRWRLLRELARSDRQVRELTSLTGHPQSLVSYHLGRLRAAQLVSARRSSADGRDAYYTVDLTRCGELLAAAGGALHPALGTGQPQAAAPRARRAGAVLVHRQRLAFPAGRGARAAAFRRLGAGVQRGQPPRSLHPNTVRVLAEHGIDVRAGPPST